MVVNKFLFFAFYIASMAVYGQKPTEVPKPSEKPIDVTNPADIIIYIVLPLCVILLFFVWREKQKKNKRK